MELVLIQRAKRVAADLFTTHQTKHFTVHQLCVNKQWPMFSRAFHWTHPLPESQVKKLKIQSFRSTNWADLQIVRLPSTLTAFGSRCTASTVCFEETLSFVLILSRNKKNQGQQKLSETLRNLLETWLTRQQQSYVVSGDDLWQNGEFRKLSPEKLWSKKPSIRWQLEGWIRSLLHSDSTGNSDRLFRLDCRCSGQLAIGYSCS